jgi:hypothetical protein
MFHHLLSCDIKMEIAMMQMQYTGSNIEAYTIYIYYDSFWITADK